mgnify:CR=1 FL=1
MSAAAAASSSHNATAALSSIHSACCPLACCASSAPAASASDAHGATAQASVTIDVVSTLLSKALALVTIAICLPFLFLFGWSVTKNALQTGLNILTHWSADTIHAGTMILEERRAAKGTVEVVVESVPASQVKGRPSPKQRKRRPARPAGGFAPVAV